MLVTILILLTKLCYGVLWFSHFVKNIQKLVSYSALPLGLSLKNLVTKLDNQKLAMDKNVESLI
jgi:hypothetical protein